MADPFASMRASKDAMYAAPPGGGVPRGDVYQKIGWLELLKRGSDAVREALPGFNHSIQVAVVGGPNADIRRLWYLCVSAVYGRFRNRVRTGLVPVAMDATWDITGKVVSMELNYFTNALASSFSSDDFRDPSQCGAAFLARGPEQLTVGGGWNNVFNPLVTRARVDAPPDGGTRPAWIAYLTLALGGCVAGNPNGRVRVFPVQYVHSSGADPEPGRSTINVLRELPFGKAVAPPGQTAKILIANDYPYRVSYTRFAPGFPGPVTARPGARALPRLPDEGRVITTAEKLDVRVQPPKPPIDGSSRSSFLGLVAAALQSPCFLPASPPCTRNPVAASGLFVTAAGAPTSADPVDLSKLWGARTDFTGLWPLGPLVGQDGYPIPTDNAQITNYGN